MKYDEEENLLLYMISESNEDVRNSLYDKYAPFIQYLVKKYSTRAYKLGLDRKDLVQEANVAFVDALNSYNPDKEASFKTFMSLCIERRLINVLNKYASKKNQIEKDALSLEFEYEDEASLVNTFLADSSLDPSSAFLEKESIEELNRKIESQLSDFERQVYRKMLNGYGYQKIALLLDKNPKQIDNTIQRIRYKMRQIMEGDNNV